MRLRVNRKSRKRHDKKGDDQPMNQQPRVGRAAEPDPASAPRIVDSTALMDGRREILIRHGDDLYRLRITASNKLILTK